MCMKSLMGAMKSDQIATKPDGLILLQGVSLLYSTDIHKVLRSISERTILVLVTLEQEVFNLLVRWY